MKSRKNKLYSMAGVLSLAMISGLSAESEVAPKGDVKDGKNLTPIVVKKADNAKQAKVQIAILLDTSGSMNGLIDQTKTQLWKIVNTFIKAEKNGQVPYVEVALYEYGKPAAGVKSDFVRQIRPLTRDLDQISTDLFSLKTSGGDEYCGAVIDKAVKDLKWDEDPNTYKAIFIAGNEAFTQGPVSAESSCKLAIAKGVIVNSIHCGSESEGINGGWKAGPLLADGKFLVIDHNAAVVHIEAPQDADIVKLNTKLNKTYVAFGQKGKNRVLMQEASDLAAEKRKESGAQVQRALSKSSANYHNSSWDLCDACSDKNFDWTKLKDEDLPENMKKMNLEERKAYIAGKQKERDEINKQIQELNVKRVAFITEKRKEMAGGEGNTLDAVVQKTVEEQASKKGYTFKK